MKIIHELTAEETQATINMLDAVVRAHGINAHAAAVYLAGIFQRGLNAAKQEKQQTGDVVSGAPEVKKPDRKRRS
jgi:hypothetical protein